MKHLLKNPQSVINTVCFQIQEYAITIEIIDPMMQELVVELVEHELVVGLMEPHSIHLIGGQYDSAKPDRLAKEQLDEVGIEWQARGAYLLPLELAVHVVAITEFFQT